jgi:Zn-dependent protease with chaperone function
MNESRATRYQRLRRRAGLAGVLTGAVALGAVAFSPASPGLAAWALSAGRGLPLPLQVLVGTTVFVVLLVVLWEVASLPAVLYSGLRVERRMEAGRPEVEDVLAAQAQAGLVAIPAALIAASAVRVSAAIAGPWWWLLAGALLAGALALALRGAPVLLARLAGTQPLGRPALAARLAALAGRARVPVTAVDEWHVGRLARASALVTGVGPTRRVLVATELVRDWSDDEIAVVVAHELAHHAYGDLWRALALDALVLSAALAVAGVAVGAAGHALRLAGPGDLAALPLIAFVAGAVWLLATPVRHAYSRRQERRADRFALVITGRPDAFSAAVRRLGARHLSEERPGRMTRWFYHRHPSMAERLALADAYRRITPATGTTGTAAATSTARELPLADPSWRSPLL